MNTTLYWPNHPTTSQPAHIEPKLVGCLLSVTALTQGLSGIA
ncbi:hypothetical protein [Streptomyces sp. CB02400]|nr:hypothetical protein [Streptomyces sp. CB02400]